MAGEGLPYDPTTPQGWLDAVEAWPWNYVGSSKWKKVGVCPRCEHEMYGVFAERIVLFSDEAEEERSGTPQEVYIECNCGAPHAGRPETETGCGPDGFFPAPPQKGGGADGTSS
jgi:hypothetical protein